MIMNIRLSISIEFQILQDDQPEFRQEKLFS